MRIVSPAARRLDDRCIVPRIYTRKYVCRLTDWTNMRDSFEICQGLKLKNEMDAIITRDFI